MRAFLLLAGCAQTIYLKDARDTGGVFVDTTDTHAPVDTDTDTDTDSDADTDADADTDTAPPTIGEICAGETHTVVESLAFEPYEDGCDWFADGNGVPYDRMITARSEDVVALALDPGDVVCDLAFDFSGDDEDEEQIIRYDDNFLLVFADVVLAASYGPMVELLEEDGTLRLYDWSRLLGTELSFDSVEPYCLGAAEGLSSCEVPPPEMAGPIELDFGDSVVDELTQRALAQDDDSFRFVTVGDNDAGDCNHAGLAFTVTVTYAER